jgi:hypothetical protein
MRMPEVHNDLKLGGHIPFLGTITSFVTQNTTGELDEIEPSVPQIQVQNVTAAPACSANYFIPININNYPKMLQVKDVDRYEIYVSCPVPTSSVQGAANKRQTAMILRNGDGITERENHAHFVSRTKGVPSITSRGLAHITKRCDLNMSPYKTKTFHHLSSSHHNISRGRHNAFTFIFLKMT